MMTEKIITYRTDDPQVLEAINDYLGNISKQRYGFSEDDEICFFGENGEIFAVTNETGKIELISDIDPVIIKRIEKKLK